MRNLFLLIFTIIPLITFTQIIESFDDGEMSANPQWYGEIYKFEVLDPPVSGDGAINSSANDDGLVLRSKQNESDAIIKIASTQAYGEWRFSVADGANWSVSSTNDYKIILVSDDSTTINLTQSNHNFNGYYIRFGSTTDQYTLFRQSGGTSTEILNTSYPSSADGNTAVGRSIKVTRTMTGDWSIFIDDGFDISASTQRGGTINDNTHTSSSWFGIATNIANPGTARVLYFDNLYIGAIVADTIKPEIQEIDIISANQIDIYFTETVDSASSQLSANYLINNSIGNPDSAILDISNGKLIHLYFTNSLISGTSYILSVQNIEDLSSNVMISDNINFTYYIILPEDIVINEIMADPTPALALPEYEFIEIYNNTPYSLELKNWTITIGSTSKTIPDFTINANDYYIICDANDVSAFQIYGNVNGISSLPALTNGGTSITIKDENDTTITEVIYSSTWYQDPAKEDGGWSLERIDPLNDCGGYTNWKASNSNDGGTPGNINSIYASNIDTIAPQVESIFVANSMQLSIKFTEPVESTSLLLSNFIVDNGIGNPVYFEQDVSDERLYHFQFVFMFPVSTTLQLTVQNIYDDCQNTLTTQTIPFVYYEAQAYDVIVNEIFADPSPVIALPEYEYLELYNRSDYDINLSGWTIKIGSSDYTFPSININKNEYLILTNSNGYNEYSGFGETIDLISSLTNSGTTISLYDQYNKIISSVSYSDDWYQDSYKAEGGWSLERIDYDNPCGGSGNWIASTNNTGGTPGSINSVYDSNPDIEMPELSRVIMLTDSTIKLYFNETLDTNSLFDLNIYSVDNGVGIPVFADPVQPDYNSIILGFSQAFLPKTIYTITINDSITDCAGNYINDDNSCKFGIPDSVIQGDIVINEILFNPLSDGVDFVEIYNKSSKIIDLKNLRIASRKEDSNIIDSYLWEIDPVEEINAEGYLIFPSEYYLFSENSSIIQEQYYTSNKKGFIEVDDLPSYNDDEDIIIIMDKWVNIIDEFHYTDDMHFALLKDVEGISLERINYNNPTQDENNWHSAAESVGYATPAYENSQFLATNSGNSDITVDPEIFSPDNDGYQDVLNINYKFDSPGYVANITIFDAKGRIIKKLVQNELLAVSGTIIWDGISDENTKARIGIYLIYFEVYDLSGNVHKYKNTCVLATKLN